MIQKSKNDKKSNLSQKPVLTSNLEKQINVFALASGIGGKEYGAELGVWDLYYNLSNIASNFHLKKIYHHNSNATKLNAIEKLEKFFVDPFVDIEYFTIKNILNAYAQFLFLTGDHFNAVAVWGALQNSIKEDIGLIWIDAQLDSHTIATSTDNNLNNMPVATLMGKNSLDKLNLLIKHPLKPENICFIGTREYDEAELKFLNSLGVKIFFMKDINKKNSQDVFAKAVEIATKNTAVFGVSLDINCLDPIYAPATGFYSANGLNPNLVYEGLKTIGEHPNFIGLEISEFNPLLDNKRNTFEIIKNILTNTFNIKN